jgi:hypothetical protein
MEDEKAKKPPAQFGGLTNRERREFYVPKKSAEEATFSRWGFLKRNLSHGR